MFLEQGRPYYTSCLKAEFWSDRDSAWHGHFVTMAKRDTNGLVMYRQVPINPEEYHRNPIEWPQGHTG